jgi:ubiquitin-protein ligase
LKRTASIGYQKSSSFDDVREGGGKKTGDNKGKSQFYSDYFRRYELMIEFTNLRNVNHCPLGVYVMPSTDNLFVWYGTLFVHKGYYRNGVFKFRLNIPQEYPEKPPQVCFLTELFHPLIDTSGLFSLAQQFPTWQPNKDYIFHVLHYIKNAFKKVVLDNLAEPKCFNKDALKMYRTKPNIFAKLAQQCAQLSITESILYENYPESNPVRFENIGDSRFEELKAQILSSSTSTTETKNSIEKQLKDRFQDFRTTGFGKFG